MGVRGVPLTIAKQTLSRELRAMGYASSPPTPVITCKPMT
jgi:hypothetical protein